MATKKTKKRELSELDMRAGTILLRHFLKRYAETHGVSYTTLWPKDQRIMARFFQDHKWECEAIIDYLFDVHGGYFGTHNTLQTPNLFSEKCKWVLEDLRLEMRKVSVDTGGEAGAAATWDDSAIRTLLA